MMEYLAGIATALLLLALLNRRTVWRYIREEYQYRRDGIYMWRALRQDRKRTLESQRNAVDGE